MTKETAKTLEQVVNLLNEIQSLDPVAFQAQFKVPTVDRYVENEHLLAYEISNRILQKGRRLGLWKWQAKGKMWALTEGGLTMTSELHEYLRSQETPLSTAELAHRVREAFKGDKDAIQRWYDDLLSEIYEGPVPFWGVTEVEVDCLSTEKSDWHKAQDLLSKEGQG